MTTAQLAKLLLPSEPPGKFVSHEVGKFGPHGEPMNNIDFFRRPMPDGTDLCRREGVSVSLQPGENWDFGKDSPVHFSRAYPRLQLAAAPKCRFRPGGNFAWVHPDGVYPLATQALRELLAIQNAAHAGAPLPVQVSCTSEPPDKACDRTPRELITSLTLDRIFIISPNDNGGHFSVMPNGPGLQRYWDVRLIRDRNAGSKINLSWQLTPPF